MFQVKGDWLELTGIEVHSLKESGLPSEHPPPLKKKKDALNRTLQNFKNLAKITFSLK